MRHLDKNTPRTSYVRVQQQNKLPYSVKPIGGIKELNEWKTWQANKELTWQAKKAAHRQYLINGIESGSLVKEYPPIVTPSPTVWQRLTEWCSDLFFKLPFNNY